MRCQARHKQMLCAQAASRTQSTSTLPRCTHATTLSTHLLFPRTAMPIPLSLPTATPPRHKHTAIEVALTPMQKPRPEPTPKTSRPHTDRARVHAPLTHPRACSAHSAQTPRHHTAIPRKVTNPDHLYRGATTGRRHGGHCHARPFWSLVRLDLTSKKKA
jgi:hypothetical protein